jgi:hypothetical protein
MNKVKANSGRMQMKGEEFSAILHGFFIQRSYRELEGVIALRA